MRMALAQRIKTALRSAPIVAPVYMAAAGIYHLATNQRLARAKRNTLRLIDADIDRAITLAIQYIRELGPGAIGEFGVYNGRYTFVECRELAAFSQTRDIHLFDSWMGFGPLSEDDRRAPEVRSGQTTSAPHATQMPPEQLKAKLERIYRGGVIHLYRGFFGETVSTMPKDLKFILVVMDANLYTATITVLDRLFNFGHVLEGAMFLFPGWNLSAASPNHGVRRAWAEVVARYGISYSDEGRYYSKGAKIIVHSYSSGLA
jgi:hypothetical protein